MYITVIFDVDGTIIDTEQAVLSSLQYLLKNDFGRNYDISELHFALGIPGTTSLAKLGIDNVQDACQKWNYYMKNYLSAVKVFTGMEKVLQNLADKHITTGIVTSKTNEELVNDFIPFGLMKYLSFVICADDTERHKPYPDPLLEFMKRSGADVETSIYIGDTEYDFQCARDAGLDFGLALWGTKTPALQAKHKFDKPEDILEIFRLIV